MRTAVTAAGGTVASVVAAVGLPAVALLVALAGLVLAATVWVLDDDGPLNYTPDCPECGHPTTGLREKHARVRGIREPVIITIADPCGCHVDDHAAALQAAAPANLSS